MVLLCLTKVELKCQVVQAAAQLVMLVQVRCSDKSHSSVLRAVIGLVIASPTADCAASHSLQDCIVHTASSSSECYADYVAHCLRSKQVLPQHIVTVANTVATALYCV
jgi:hypothetical protein